MEADEPDWYCTHVLPGRVAVDVVRETPEVLAFRPPMVQETSAEVIRRHGGCQAITSIGDEQGNRHLHVHLAVGEGVARFIRYAQPPEENAG
ncbi:hypothetical protein [Streptomyces sp. GbtcB7]|uniref:hypothetical protein n=1 Tax=Streptomyces sp. GbtcB7 TaxID=2824752 RepID=UPI001C302148|nr:hypothetical protein [Streptomyces sp. GbtcB7]